MKKRDMALFGMTYLMFLFLLNGCAPAMRAEAADESVEWKTVVSIKDQEVPLSKKPPLTNLRIPQASGTVIYKNNDVLIDASNTNQGYVMIKYTGDSKLIRIQVIKEGGETYNYILNNRSSYEIFPLTEHSGTYTVRVLEQVRGNQYGLKVSQSLNVTLGNEFEPFLYPNKYVNFSPDSRVVKKGAELASQASDPVGIVTNIYNYVVTNITYDDALASSVQTDYIPDLDRTLTEQKGICFDYAAVMTAMLRSQNIPTKLVVGYTGSVYHAWVSIYLDGQGWVDNIIYFDGNVWKLMDPTYASSGGNDPKVKEYISNSSNYKAKFTY
ncbi:transglutaminase-like domain-containing protein [Clostridium sp. E02]|uniref:transglutaminase-like domain-containing protein n=1 Tax=Clostridium sp. E02 TaxID=2487134 RepID=UPI000F539CE3|nr:transglutaminase-like domain-containing protein [Clostridium sp. E02]